MPVGTKPERISMGEMPIPGRVEPTRRRYDRITVGRSADWRWWRKKLQPHKDRPGTLICPRCHAISDIKRWYFDEERYQQLKGEPEVGVVRCPGCERLDRQLYEGEVHLRSPLLLRNKWQALGLIRNQEWEAMQENPISRVAQVQDHGEEVVVITTTAFLAKRIGREFKKAWDGMVRVDRLPGEKFNRVYWYRPEEDIKEDEQRIRGRGRVPRVTVRATHPTVPGRKSSSR